MLRRIASLPVRRPVAVLLVTLAATSWLGSRLVDPWTGEIQLALDPGEERLLPDGDEARAFFETSRQRFGRADALLVALVFDDLFRVDNLAAVRRTSEALAALPEVASVLSLANAPNIRSLDGDLAIEPFLDPLPADASAAARLRDDVMRHPIYAASLVSADGRSAALLVSLRAIDDAAFLEAGLDRRLLAVASEAAPNAEVLLTGPAAVKAETTRLILESLRTVLPLAAALLCVIGAIAYRSVLGVATPLLTVGIALVWTLGALAWAGVSLNLVTAIVPPLLLTVGFAYAVHIVTAWTQAAREDPLEIEAAGGFAAWALRHTALPVSLTGLTTIAGFLALTLSDFGAVREFGWISVVGVASTVLATLSFAPAVLQLAGPPRAGGSDGGRRFDDAMERLAGFVIDRRPAVLAAGAAVALLSFWGATRIEVNTDVISNFAPDHPVRRHVAAINQSLQGANPFTVVLRSEQRDAFVQPENLAVVEALQARLRELPEIGGSTSMVDYVKLLHRALRDDDPTAFSIPDRARLTKQLLLLGGGEELSSFVDGRYQHTAIYVRSRTVDSAGSAALIERVDAELAALPDHIVGRVTGNSVLLARAMDDVSQGQLETLSVAFLFIYVVLVGLFTSFRAGLLALVPNVLPVLLYFGALGLLGIGLNTTTGLFACMILGIAVDDTIHFLSRFNAEARERVDERTGAIRALRYVGRPVTITTVGLCLGFLALTSSELRSQAEFGALGAFTLAFAWLVDVTFTPALCSGMRVVTLWDALTFDLGRDPHRSIPAFRGLSKTQARIAALTTSVTSIEAGTRIIRTGDPGDRLYVVIEGELNASIENEGGRVDLARAGRGDVVGEVGLYHGVRTADVDAITDVRALCLTRDNLERLRRRHPRIAAVVFWNLSEVLAARLAKITPRVS